MALFKTTKRYGVNGRNLLTLVPQKKGIRPFTVVWVDETILGGQVVTFEWSFVFNVEADLASILLKHEHLALAKISECFMPVHHIKDHRLLILVLNFDQGALMLQGPAWTHQISFLQDL